MQIREPAVRDVDQRRATAIARSRLQDILQIFLSRQEAERRLCAGPR